MSSSQRQDRVPPNNIRAEESLLGAMLLSANAIETALALQITADDFYKPAHGHIFEAITQLHQDRPADVEPWVNVAEPVPVADLLRRQGLLDAVGGPGYLVSLQVGAPATSNTEQYCKIVSEYATMRRLIGFAGDVLEMSHSNPEDVAAAVERAENLLGSVKEHQPVIVPEGLTTLDDLLEFADAAGDEFAPWLIPDLIKATTRVVIVAKSGTGKSLLLQQIGIAAAAGLHPFTRDYLPRPLRVLIVDLENPLERLVNDTRAMHADAIKRIGADLWDRSRCAIWPHQQPMDLMQRRDRAALEAAIKRTQPELVLIGPIYKMADMEGPAGMAVASKVMRVMDDLRTRYGFGLILEGHAPSTDGGGPLRARGTEQWNYWPEIGIALTETTDAEDMPAGTARQFALRRMRGDRVKVEWPALLSHSRGPRDGPWPWIVERGPGASQF